MPKPKHFRIMFFDDEACTMNVSEITADDEAVTDRTAELQHSGRLVHISTTTPQADIDQVPSAEGQYLAEFERDPNLRW